MREITKSHDTNAMHMYVVCIARYYLFVYVKRGKIMQYIWDLIIISTELWSFYYWESNQFLYSTAKYENSLKSYEQSRF